MLILASASPRRRQLLRQWKVAHRVIPSHLPEPPPGRTSPIRYARRLALAKALAVEKGVRPLSGKRGLTPSGGKGAGSWVLGADTIVVVGRRILGKPRDAADAERMLRRLSGSRHRVITAVALVAVRPELSSSVRPERRRRTNAWIRHAVTWVTMRRLTLAEIRRFARRHRDKAGSYAIQANEPVVTRIDGSRTNVVGLPKDVVLSLLRRAGIS